MMKKFFIIFVFVFLSNAFNSLLDLGRFELNVRLGDGFTPRYQPMDATDIRFSHNILKIAETVLKDHAIVPLIEPYMLDRFAPIPVNTILLHDPVTLTNIKVAGISKVQIDNLEIRMNKRLRPPTDSVRSDVVISIPFIEGSADVSTSTKVLFLTIPVAGTMKLVLHGLKASVIAQLTPVRIGDQETYQYEAVDVVTTVDDVELQLNIEGLPNLMEKHLVLELIRLHKEEVGHTIAEIVVQQVNRRIARFSKRQILDIAAGKTSYSTVVDMVKVAIGPNPHHFDYY